MFVGKQTAFSGFFTVVLTGGEVSARTTFPFITGYLNGPLSGIFTGKIVEHTLVITGTFVGSFTGFGTEFTGDFLGTLTGNVKALPSRSALSFTWSFVSSYSKVAEPSTSQEPTPPRTVEPGNEGAFDEEIEDFLNGISYNSETTLFGGNMCIGTADEP
ncbi:MAG: hypothetical protein LBP53_08420 [Candidatus Peribacteria bacterium]|jgi:hypothetical protein|nr:hypothetical protein [Candidatus Peribacteria bacterium]